jgi:hypothetical protein
MVIVMMPSPMPLNGWAARGEGVTLGVAGWAMFVFDPLAAIDAIGVFRDEVIIEQIFQDLVALLKCSKLISKRRDYLEAFFFKFILDEGMGGILCRLQAV